MWEWKGKIGCGNEKGKTINSNIKEEQQEEMGAENKIKTLNGNSSHNFEGYNIYVTSYNVTLRIKMQCNVLQRSLTYSNGVSILSTSGMCWVMDC